MEIKFYNSLTNNLETFTPLIPNKVSMYVCGPTVYNYPHIGNMRPVVVFDTLRRFLSYVGYDVTYVSNFTDVDDKIIKEAKAEHKTEKELTEFYINEFLKVTKLIGSLPPTITPKVTEYMEKIIDYVDRLVKLDAAYVKDGDVYFRVSKIADYGSLSNINIDDLIVGARIEENTQKESPLDFALWKKTSEGIAWDSPWSKGRPGWHTECCVMIDSIFSQSEIDIHGGGYDLKFPHHENEIAQAEAMHHNKIARYWMHNGFINFGNEKMSKSLGNVIYAKDMINQYGGPVTRLVILSTHYRQPVNFTEDTIKTAVSEITRIQQAYKQGAILLQTNHIDLSLGQPKYIEKFLSYLSDDLNTSNALTEVFNIVKEVNQISRSKEIDFEKLNNLIKTLKDMFYVLGLDLSYPLLNEEDLSLLEAYNTARREKDYAKSDEIRALLINKGIL